MLLRPQDGFVAGADERGPEVRGAPFGFLCKGTDRGQHRSLDRLPHPAVGGVARGPERPRQRILVDRVLPAEDFRGAAHDLGEDDAGVAARAHQRGAR